MNDALIVGKHSIVVLLPSKALSERIWGFLVMKKTLSQDFYLFLAIVH